MTADGRAPAPNTSPERRYLSIMFVDVVGFTRLSEEVDPEDLLTIQRRYRQIALNVTERFGGFVGDFAGDGVLVYFGYPSARGNDAERAVRAAFEMVSQLGGTEFPLADGGVRKLQVRIGVHTGLVVVGRETVRAGETPLGVVGAAVNIASRLQNEAPPSGVVVSGETYSLVQGLFEFLPLGWRTLKGLTQPIEVFHAMRTRPVALAGPVEARARTGAAMIGREPGLAKLLACWRAVSASRRGQIVEIVGDAGVGKTRLVNEFCLHPATSGATLIQNACHELFANTPLYPVGQHLWKRAGLAIEDDTETRQHKLGELLGEWDVRNELNALILASLPGLALTAPTIELIAPTPHLFKRARFALIAGAFHKVAAGRPTVLVLEDAHWVDPSSAELLAEIAEKRDAAYLVVVTRRSFPKGPTLPPPDETIRLEPLREVDCLALARSLPGAQSLTEEAVRAACQAAEGVPLFVEQLMRALVDERAQGITRNRKGASLPLLLAEMMSERLDRLPGSRRIVQAAACLGRSFRPEFLAALVREDPAALAEPLELLVEAEILLPKRHGLEIRYEFRHALIRRMADESTLDRDRRALHARMVELLDREGDVRTAPEMLAHHQTEAGLFGDAIASWIEAGRKAAGQSAHSEAIDHLNKGLKLLERIPDATVRHGLEMRLLAVMIGSVTITQGATSFELAAHCARGLELSREFPTPMVFPFIFGQFTFANCRGLRAEAEASADLFLSLSEQMRYAAGRVIGHRLKAMLALGAGELIEAKHELERSISIVAEDRDAGSTSIYGQNAQVHSQAMLSQALFCLGDVEQALRVGREALLALDDLRHPHSTAITIGYIGGNVFGYIGATRHLLREAQRLLAVCEQHDLPGFRPHALGFLGWGLAQSGQYAEGVALMERAIREFDAIDYKLALGAHLTNLAEALRRMGRLDEAKAYSARAIDNLRDKNSGWAEAEILRVDALIEHDLSQGDTSEAVERLERAAEQARRIGSPVFERRCLLSLVEVGGATAAAAKAEERLAALAHLDRMPELVDAIMSEARVFA